MLLFAKFNELSYQRLKGGKSVRKLAIDAQVSPATVLNIEGGKPLNPSTAKKICVALNCEFDDLFFIQSETSSELKAGDPDA